MPAIAWRLHVHTTDVKYEPQTRGVAFRARNTAREGPTPPLDSLGGEAAVQTFAIGNGWRIVGRCA